MVDRVAGHKAIDTPSYGLHMKMKSTQYEILEVLKQSSTKVWLYLYS